MHKHARTYTKHNVFGHYRGLQDRLELMIPVITANSICHLDQATSSALCVRILYSWRKIGGHILNWPSKRRSPDVPLTGISLTGMAWGFRTQTHKHITCIKLPLFPGAKTELAVRSV